ncbi:MAG: flagellar biosynthetic protein FliO [Lachnospiraceae bacterium]|nr:flagellar biosynthetic protein FliO [Lachnospiraceae bacterium]
MILLIKSSPWESIVQLIVVFIMFLFVLALAYFAARFAGRFQGNIQSRGNIKVLESARVANNKYIQLVKIGERYYAVGIGKDTITFLTELSRDDLNLDAINDPARGSFKDILSQLQKKKEENEEENEDDYEDDEETE